MGGGAEEDFERRDLRYLSGVHAPPPPPVLLDILFLVCLRGVSDGPGKGHECAVKFVGAAPGRAGAWW